MAGFVADHVGRLIKKTLLNPVLTLPLLLWAKYTAPGQRFSGPYRSALSAFNILAYWGVLRVLNNLLNRRALTNGVKDTYEWSKEVVVLTGGSDGIGKAIAKVLAASNVKVAVLDVQAMTYEAPPTVHYFKCDITSSSAIARAASEIRSELGEPTVLMNVAGVMNGKTILDGTEAEHKWVLEVNTLSHYLLAKEFVPSMAKKNHGTVVTVASLASYLVTSNSVDYAASKAAAVMFHEGLTTELVTRYNAPKVRTLLVTQGVVRTSLVTGWLEPKGFLMYLLEPETVAEGIVKRVMAGQGGQLILPGWSGLILPPLAALPYWMSNSLRNKCAPMALGWKGRMVEDPNEKYAKT